MDNSMLKMSSNWTQIGGCLFSQAFQLFTADPDIFKRPDLDDIVDEEKSILLSKSDPSDYCELYIGLYPQYKIQYLSMVCNAAKIEIFFGPIKEYLETIYGVRVDELDDQFKTYRYDIEVKKSGVTDLTLKFITHSSEICIFGIILYLAPNPNGITTLLPRANCFNTENMKTGSTEDSCKSEQLLELLKMTKMFSDPSNTSNATMDQLKEMNTAEEKPLTVQMTNDVLLKHFKLYIDERLQKLEERLQCRLEKMEERQTRKLDDILNRLENLKPTL